VLPDSFSMLTGLQKLALDGNPLRIPPREVAEQGKEVLDPQLVNECVHSFGSLEVGFENALSFLVSAH